MATVKIVSTETHGHNVEVKLEARTSMGPFTFPFAFEDQGSTTANEKQAYRELRIVLQEALAALGDR